MVYVEAKIAGCMMRCLVDTGAGVSLVPVSVTRDCCPCSTPLVLEMASGQRLPVEGEVTLPVELGNHTIHHRFFVADVAVGVILGVVFLMQNSIDILFSDSQLRWPGGAIPIQRPLNTGRRLVSCRAALIEDVCLTTSQKEMIVLAELVDEHGQPVGDCLDDCLFEPDGQLCEKYGILGAPALVNCRPGGIPVRILNTGGSTKLYRGKTLGQVSDSVDHCQLNTLHASSGLPPTEKAGIPAWDDFDRSQSDLSTDERKKLQQLIEEYSDLFSTGPGDIGRTTVTRHTIDTGTTRPVRQQPYRQPFHIRKEVA